jgi:hypothetical protein
MAFKSMRVLLAAIAISLVAIGLASARDLFVTTPSNVARYAFLRHSHWYVPPATLPAMSFDLATGATTPLVDQTVWEITDYRYGYFWGRSVAQFRDATTGKLFGPPACTRLIGSVTAGGKVRITLIGQGQQTADGATIGTGQLVWQRPGRGLFTDMQMASGSTTLVSHWSYMAQCQRGQSCERRLPGTKTSLSDFLALCPS